MNSKLSQSRGVILWDIDGTIISPVRKMNSSPHISTVLNHGIEPNGQPRVLVAPTDYEMLEDLIKDYGGADKLSVLTDCFKEIDKESSLLYTQNSLELCLGMPDALVETSKIGWDNGVLTGNTYKRMMLKLSGVLDYFESNLMFECKFGDSRETIAQRASEILGCNRINNVIIVGDTPRDISVAKKFDFQVVSVASGLFSTEELEIFKPNLMLQDFKHDIGLFLSFLNA